MIILTNPLTNFQVFLALVTIVFFQGQSSLRADSSSSKLTPQERLKKKMQALLNRQCQYSDFIST